jgi:glycosyltransferase involved in cell wall biosynthesis
MRVYAIVHLYPFNNGGQHYGFSGAEMYIHRTLLELRDNGIEVEVIQLQGHDNIDERSARPQEWYFEGVRIRLCNHINNLPTDGDVYITHLTTVAQDVIHWCLFNEKRCVYVNHNPNRLPILRSLPKDQFRVIHNSKFVSYDTGLPDMIWTPPVDTDRCTQLFRWRAGPDCKTGYITLVNAIPAKGSDVFKRLAQLMPHRKFLAVEGGYGTMDRDMPPNVTIQPQTPDILRILSMTRILLMPSKFESWGMIGAEAQACGVPVIAKFCKETMGMVENLGQAALYVYEDQDITAWIDHINKLDESSTWCSYAYKGLERQSSRRSDQRVDRLLQFIRSPIPGGQPTPDGQSILSHCPYPSSCCPSSCCPSPSPSDQSHHDSSCTELE